MVDVLAVQGAKALVFDYTMDEPHPDPSGEVGFAEYARRRNLPVYLGVNTVPRKDFKLPKVEQPDCPTIANPMPT